MQTDILEGFRLSPLQKRLWLLQQNGRPYGSQAVVALDGALDRERLRAALATVAGEHEILRTTFSALPGMEVPLQVIGEPASLSIREVDLGAAANEEEIGSLLEADREAVVDFARGPLLRATLALIGPGRQALLLTLPALCADARGLEVIVREVARSYASGPRLSGELIQYADFSEWQHELLQAEDGEKGRKHWQRASLPDPAAIRLPFERESATTAGFAPRVVAVRIDATSVAALDGVAARCELNAAEVLLACWQTVLWRRTGEAELTLGVFFDGRKYDDLRHAVGLFGRYLPVAVQIQADHPLAQLARQWREAVSTAADWQEYFIWELTGCDERSFFAFGFEHVEDLPDERESAGVRFAISRLASCTDYFKVRLACRRVNGELALDFWYDPRLYAEEGMQLLAEAFAALLREALERPEAPVGNLAALGPRERLRLVAELNDTGCALPPSSFLALFAAQAERSPEALAVVFADRSMTYAALNRESNRLARHLRRLGVREDDRVVLFLDRSVDLVVGLLGALKAGAAFVPFDPWQPKDRLQSMFQDADARAVLTEEHLAERLPASGAAVVRLDADRERISHLGSGPIAIEVSPHQLAYVIFTSGSTGRPKGTLLERGALANLVHALDRSIYAGRTSPLRVSVNAPLSFDASIKQVTRLLFGDALYIVPEEIRPDGGVLLEWLSRHRIDVLDCTPSQLHLLLAAGFEQAAIVPGRVLVGGEAVGTALWDRLAASERSRFFNVYGPTECTVDTTLCAVEPGAPTIGRPISNVAVYVIDERGDLAPLGMPGELHVGGVGLARGYLERPGLTAEKFVPDPLGRKVGARLYRTGDLVRYREDGSLDFLGRVDHQVKLRGFRIELGEIERALERHPAVAEVVVLMREDAPGDQRLTAYVVPRSRAAGPMGDRPSYTLPNGMTVAHQNRNETEYLYREIFEEGCYVKHGIALPENACVFDVGANIGMFSLFVSQVCPTASIYAFEPIPPIFESLSLNTNLYVQGARRFPFGLSSEAKVAPFTYYPRYTMMSGLADYADPEGEVEVIRRFLRNEERSGAEKAAALVAEIDELLAGRFEGETHRCMLRRLGDVIREEGVERIDLLKIDVQRAELEVLQGLREEDWSKLQQIVMEVHDEEGGQTAGRIVVLRDLLASRGFDVIVEQDELLAGTDRYNLYAARTGGGLRRGAEPVRMPLAQPAVAALSAGALRDFLRPLLPDVMIPAAVVLLDRFPLTRNGKVDRAALPVPEVREEGAVRKITPPRTPFEELLAGTWSEILGIERIDVADNFFDLGGHSLLATQLMSRVRQVFRVDVPLRTLFESPTLEELAHAVEQAQRGEDLGLPPIVPVPRENALPLSFSQERMWFLHQLDSGLIAYNILQTIRLRGQVDHAVLRSCFSQLALRHETLRTVFVAVEGTPIQAVQPPAPLLVARVDLRQIPAHRREIEAHRRALDMASRPFDLARGPLIRVSLFQLAADDHIVSLLLHRIISDGWSMHLLVSELASLYRAGVEGRPSPLPELPFQYVDFATWQRNWLSGEVLARHVAYWQSRLAGAPPLLELPTDWPRPAMQSVNRARSAVVLETGLVRELTAFSRRRGVTPFMTLCAAFGSLLWHYTRAADLVMGFPIANRDRAEIAGLVGTFVNLLPLRTELEGGLHFAELTTQVRDIVLAALVHQDLPFEKLVDELQPERALSYSPLFQVMFDLHSRPLGSLDLSGVSFVPSPIEENKAQVDLTLALGESVLHAGPIEGFFEYDTELFDRATIERWAGHYVNHLVAVAAEPQRPIAGLPLLGEAERFQLLQAWNDTRVERSRGTPAAPGVTIHDLIAARAAETPEAAAVTCGSEVVSYGALDARANRLANYLRQHGVGLEARVAICLERTPELVVALLAVLKAGGAYVPLDPSHPAERTAMVLADVGAAVLLTEERWLATLPVPQNSVQVVCVDRLEAIAAESVAPRAQLAALEAEESLAYVIYTSGSTGRPKGVQLPHRAVVNLLLAMAAKPGLTAADVVPALATITFDIAGLEIYLPLLVGGRVEMVGRHEAMDGTLLAARLAACGATMAQATPATWRLLLAAGWEGAAGLRVLCGGEALPRDLADALRGRVKELWNAYGPTETAIYSTAGEVGGGPDPVLLGAPIANTRIYVVALGGGGGELVPVGVPGELWIGGAGLARGYLGQPDLTAERFVPDPFSGLTGEAGSRLYRTGDLVRYRMSGGAVGLEFLGRIDQQVKVRGYRIELGEIEAALGRHPVVAQGVVVLEERREDSDERRLVAYLVAHEGQAVPAASELRAFLQKTLPEYMIPAAFMVLPAYPLTPSGKVDRRALPVSAGLAVDAGDYSPPQGPIEELLVEIWSEVLYVERVGAQDDFFALGGHSLLATQVLSRIRAGLGTELPLQRLFEAPTLRGLARAIEMARQEREGLPMPPLVGVPRAPLPGREVGMPGRPRRRGLLAGGSFERESSRAQNLPPSIEPVPRDRPLPLSFAQQRLWFLDLLQPGSLAYNSSSVFRLAGDLRVDVLERVMTEMVRRHETLRTVFEAMDGVPVQCILPARPYLLALVDLTRLSNEERYAELRRLARWEAARPFDLRSGPLWRFSVARIGEAEHVAFFSLHHSIADGWSMGVLIRELTALYDALLNDRPSPLPPLGIQFADYAWWQRQWLQGEVLESLLAYWRRQLAGAPPRLDLPTDRPRPALQTFAGAVQIFQWPLDLSQALRLRSRGAGVTGFMVLLAGFQALLRRHTGLEDISIGTAIANRNRLEAEGLIGLLVNTLVLRVAVPGDPVFLELLKKVRDVCLEAYAHQDVPFEKLVEELQPQRSLSHSPLFQVGFDFQNLRQEALHLGRVQVSRISSEISASKFDFTLSMDQSDGLLHGAIEYNPDLFDGSTIRRLLGHFQTVLEGVADHPGLRLSELPLLSEAERHQAVIDWNDMRCFYVGGDRTLHALVEAQAERTPDAVAVSSEEGSLRYGELERRANQLARFLRRLGVGPEVPVGVAVERSLDMVVGVLGVLKAGGAYVPFDPEVPPGRLALMLEDSGVRVVLARRRLAGAVPEGDCARVWLDTDGERIARESGARLAPEADGSCLAYVIYTSGSTGRPKGVMVEHRSILNRLLWMQERFPLAPGDILFQKTPLTFDASVWELFVPLFAGARLELARPGGQRDSEYLVRRVREAGVTVLQLVPSQLRVFLDEPGAAECASLRRLFCGGEVLPESLRERAFAQLGAELCNLYGPTEASIDASYERCARGESRGNSAVPIGRALGNVRLYLLGGEQSPVPLGVAGELHIGGVNLARGYAGRPDLTAERFVPDGLSGEAGTRLYRTGDQARYLADGRIEYLGRLDHQVKVRGVRIEPGEIEALLRRHPAVHEAVVVMREDAPGEPRLVAYAVAGRGEAAESAIAPPGNMPEIWPCVGEYQIYDELLYWAMIKDERRNTLYRRAIERLVPDRTVLDVGTGRDAIWARYCAEAGARSVYAVEILDEAYEHAAALVERLGLTERITVLRGDIATIELPEKVDVCVSNLIGTIGGSEGAARLLSAARRLVAVDGDFIPRRCATQIAAVTLPEELRRNPGFPPVAAHYVERIFAAVGHSFDVRLSIRSFPLENVISTSEVFEDLDFSAPVDARFERAIRLTIKKDATLDGFLLWLELQTIENEVIDTLHHVHSWLPVYLPVFGSGVAVTAGDVLEVLCRGELCDDGIHPDYEVRGRLLRLHGSSESFRFVSPHHDAVFRGVPLYRSLFPGGGPRILAEAAVPVPSERELRTHLRDFLPEYLIPSQIVLLESLPLTPSGKLDRRALPAPGRTIEQGEECTGARNLIEELLISLWQEILGLEPVGIHDDFFALGGHSLLATRIVSRIRSAVQVDLEVRDLFEAPTIARLAQRIEEAKRSGTGVAAPPLVPGPRGGRYPLSFAQERMWFLHRLAPRSAAYNVTIAVKLDGRLDRNALAETLGEIVRRHEVLRARFVDVEGDPWQEIEPFRRVTVPLVDLSDLPAAAREARSAALVAQEAATPFELATCPPFRMNLVRIAETEHLLLLSLHHIVSDAWSQGVLIREVAVLYPSFAQGKAQVLAPLPVQYADFAAWQRNWLQGEALAAYLDWWRERLRGAPAILLLPTDRPRSTAWRERGATRQLTLPAFLTIPVRELSREQGATPFMTLLALFDVLLSRWSGETDISTGTPVAGRDRVEIEGLIGLFLNTLVLRTDLGGSPAFGEVVKRVRETALGAHAHQALPFEKLVDDLAPRRDLGHPPLFQVLFDYQNPTQDALELPGLQLSRLEIETGTTKFDLALSMGESGGRFYGSLQYATDLFDAGTIDRLLGHFAVLLAEAVAAPERQVGELPLLSEGERHHLLAWNDTAELYAGSECCLQELIEQRVQSSPDRVAVEVEGEALTYGELWQRSRLLGRYLLRLGVGPEDRVGLCLERSLELMVGLLGILQAGGAYVPLDPEYPRERLAYMVEDSGARVVLLQERLSGVLPEGGFRRVLLDTDWRTIERQEARVPETGVSPESLAYVIYTSGSTGWPKGAMNTHRGIVNRLLWMQSTYGLDETDAVLQKTPASFDVSVWEFFWPLLAGGRLVMARSGGHREGEYLVKRIVSANVTTAHFVPSMLRTFLETAGVERCAGPLRQVMASGEALTGDLEQRFLAHLGSCELHNLYGPTEAAVDVTSWRCTGDSGERGVPIGRPIANTQIHLLDAADEAVPVGVSGELYIGGVSLARGYVGRPELTAERFVPSPRGSGERLYRTGDLARWRADGAVEYLGRVDNQVKMRGFRIELGEIEAVLARHPGIAATVVAMREESPGDRRLVAYVVAAEGKAPGAEELRRGLQERLPDYMVPSVFVFLEALPLTPSGKVDRRALPAPGGERPDLAAAYTGPRTPVEEVLAGIWERVLRLERVGAHDDFFALGGHSLLATQVASRIRSAFGIELPLRALFEAVTVSRLAARIEGALKTAASAAPPLLRASREEDIALSFAQERLWFLDQLDPGNPAYNIPVMVGLTGELEIEALRRSLGELLRRHEALRTSFPAVRGRARQVVHDGVTLPLPVVDLSALPAPQRSAELRKVAREEVQRPFDLFRPLLVRAIALRLEPTEHAVVLCVHHIVSDGWSMGVLIEDVARLYEAFQARRPSPLPELPIQYADFAVWQRQWLQGDVLAEQLAFWRQQMAEAPPILELPVDRPRPPVPSYRGASRSLSLSVGAVATLRLRARAGNATPFMMLLTAWYGFLARVSGQTDVLVGTPIAGRNRLETERLIGLFVNTLVLRADLSEDPSFTGLLDQVRARTLEAHVHQDLPFEKLVNELEVVRNLGHAPLFQVMFAFQNTPRIGLELAGLALSELPTESGTAKFDLTLALQDDDGGIVGSLQYAKDLFDAVTIARLARHFMTLLSNALEEPERRIQELPLLSEGERHQLMNEWSGGGQIQSVRGNLHQRLAAQARRRPRAPAIVCEGVSLTYGDLDGRANALAQRLLFLGVEPGARVGLLAERSLDLVVGILGILKAGCAYVPLDPTYPRERLEWMLEDAGAAALVLQRGLAERLAATPERKVWLEDLASAVAGDPEVLLGSESTAYVIYTSGSTGRPKGVVISHGNVLQLLDATAKWFDFGEEDVWTLFHSAAFDFSTWELWGALLYGGRLVVVPYPVSRSPEAFYALLEGERVTVLNQTPSAFLALQEVESARRSTGGLSLRWVIFGGEALDPRSLAPFWRRHGGSGGPGLVNMYGITETTVHVTFRRLGEREVEGSSGSVIGVPHEGLRGYVLDGWREPVPIGVPGELFLGGAGLAQGYLRRPELTAERFVPDGFGQQRGGRLYRSGDLVRWHQDGELEYLGRIDQQVKVRGFRIELGEIESILRQELRVGSVVVTLREDAPGDRRLVAYLGAGDGGSLPGVEELRGRLKAWLPEHMIPAAFVVLPSLPLTPNGKVDWRALPEPGSERPDLAGAYTAPRDRVEKALVEAWSRVLRLDRVGVHDNFFALGGDSILAIQIVSRAAEAGLRLQPRHLFQYQTVAELAAVAEPILPATAEVERAFGEVPLTPVQHWFFARRLEMAHHFNQSVLLAVRERLEPAALGAALSDLLARHGALRLRFEEQQGLWRSRYAEVDDDAGASPLAVVDLSALPESLQGPAITAACTAAQGSLDLGRGPLLRGVWVDLGGGQQAEHPGRLLLVIHHLAVDGVSWRILLEELVQAYQSRRLGEVPQLAAATSSYRRWAERLEQYASSEPVLAEAPYWLSKVSPGRLPVDFASGENRVGAARTVEVSLEEEETRALLQQVPGVYRTRIQEVLLTALVEAFAVWTGERRVGVDLEGHGREEVGEGIDVSRTVGWFTTIYPVVLDLRRTYGAGESLRAVKEQLRAVPQKGLGYGLLRYLSGDRELQQRLASLPDREVSFNYLGQLDQVLEEGSSFVSAPEPAGPAQAPQQTRLYLVEINGRVMGGRLHLSWSYGGEVHRQETIEVLAGRFVASLRALIAHCLSAEAGGYTPSDFPLARLDGRQLERVLGKVGKVKR